MTHAFFMTGFTLQLFPRTSASHGATLVVGSLLLAAGLAESYRLVATLTRWDFWAAAASVHTLLSVMVLAYRKKSQEPAREPPRLPKFLASSPLLLVGLTAGAATFTRWLWPEGVEPPATLGWAPMMWILWIPFVEEVVFRVGIASYVRGQLGVVWGCYYAALFFAFMHSFPTFERIASLSVGISPGPFFLGLASGYLWYKYQRLWLIVALHAACNATGAIFSQIDSRWLGWLGILYQ